MSGGSNTIQQPLFAKTIIVTRRKEQAKEFSDILEHYGAKVILFPTVEISEPTSWNECDSSFKKLSEYSGIIFTSINAVEYFFKRAETQQKLHQLKNIPLFAVGEKTKNVIESFGFQTEEIPSHFSAEQLARTLTKKLIAGKKFLFPKGNLARHDLGTILSLYGATVDGVTVYQTREPQLDFQRQQLLFEIQQHADMVTFFSPSSVNNFLHSVSLQIIKTKHIAAFGVTTAAAAKTEGLNVDVVAPNSTIEIFAEAILNFYTTSK